MDEPEERPTDEDVLSRATPEADRHERPPEPPEKPSDQPEEREADEERPAPHIYVACLADYNAGGLHGAWISAAQGPEALAGDIDRMLAQSPTPGAEEWAIHDYEGFWPLELDEYESLEVVSRLAIGIAEHGPPFAAWVQRVGDDIEQVERFARVYLGRWESVEAYTEHVLVEHGARSAIATLPAWLQPYVHLDAVGYARDLQAAGQIWTVPAVDGEGVEVFDETIWQWTIPEE